MPKRATFGPFELDFDDRELRKNGIRLRLPQQSYEILALLAGRPGQIVTRDEIRERLWPRGTVVEFEHSINAALKRLRDTLGDSAAQPRFIETVSGRGYIFIAPLQHAVTGTGEPAQRQWEAAERELNRILHIDPASPLLNYQMLLLLVDMHRYEPALDQFHRLIELDPSSANAYSEASRIYSALGREPDAISAFLKSRSLSGDSAEPVNDLAAAARQGGIRTSLRVHLQQLQQQSKDGHVSPVLLAGICARLGDKDAAFALLEAAYQEHKPRLMWIKARSTWDPLRSDPRFQDLLRRMRFSP